MSDGNIIGEKHTIKLKLGLQNHWRMTDTAGWHCTTGLT